MFKQFSNIDKIIKEKNIKIHYPEGYKHWKKKFEDTYKKTKSVSRTLDEIHGVQKKEK